MTTPFEDKQLVTSAQRTLEIEADAVRALSGRIDDHFVRACRLILACEGRVVVTGMGKSGHIGSKIAATLASTGTPAFFVHPGEASHGDLGMITRQDVVLALSNSGTTSEIVTLLPLLRRLGIPLVAMTGNPDSTLALAAEAHLNTAVASEACPLGLAPTSSTTAALAMGDALAVALLEARGFTAEDFAFSHPGGALGRRLLLKVEDIMHAGEEVPCVSPGTPLKEALLEMSRKGMGMTAVTTDDNGIAGIFTDGDLRRALDRGVDINTALIDEVMTVHGKTVTPGMLAAEALGLMESNKINALLVADENDRLAGALTMHDLLRAGVL
ncbi:MAG: KpsF/GutQ family sugar-phosphate isomerase [Gammaproteobacteria bacterium]|nr:MAG: KpsF/GutQ family sugar-phosphate isomerase [Gammaproteobacteria bacterium]